MLPDLEQTLGELVLDLLRAPAAYSELILSEPVNTEGEVAPDAVRVTQHYTTALLAYGFTPEQDELRAAAAWFATPFPSASRDRIDAVEMNRLEAMLSLCPENPYVLPRLEQLARQQSADGGAFIVEAGGRDFDTLWALKVLTLAERQGIMNGVMDREQLRRLAGRMLRQQHRDKDLALALRLRHDLAEGLRQSQRRYLDRLLTVASLNGGVWGLTPDMTWITEHLARQQLAPGDVAGHPDAFREMVISTCYVIENLMPLAPQYPELKDVLAKAMLLWWGAFHGRDAVDRLRAFFPMPYDYLLVLARTLVALRAYLQEPLIRWGAAHVHRKLAEQRIGPQEPPDRQSIRQALRKWLWVDLDGPIERLRLGMSDSDVVRVRPSVRNPMQPDVESGRLRIPYADSLIIKYGRVEEVDKERESYNSLPIAIRDCFVPIPSTCYLDDHGRAFVVMQDLYRYRTLDEVLRKVPQAREALPKELGPFLLRMHRGDARQPLAAQYGLLWRLYLMPMQEHVGRVFNYIQDHGLLDEKGQQEKAARLRNTLLDLIGNLVRYQLRLEGFPVAYMHGDLHTRNVMVRLLRRRERLDPDRELDFKLIDLEKFQRDGDAAMDAGELLADLYLALAPLQGSDKRPLLALSEALEATYMAFAEERQDETFPIRVQLAKARALIRVAKGRTKVGEAALRESRRAPAISIAFEALGYAGEAVTYLQAVLDALGSASNPFPDNPAPVAR